MSRNRCRSIYSNRCSTGSAITDAEVREAAMLAVVPLHLRAAIPRLLAIAGDTLARDRAAAIEALCGLPDARAVSFYLAAIKDRDPRLHRAGESALLAIRDQAADRLASTLASGTLAEPATLSLERVLARFEPIRDWRVIGPFPRTTASVFVGERAIDFARSHTGALGAIDLVGIAPGRRDDRPCRPERLQAGGRRPGRVRLRRQRLARPGRLRVYRGRGRSSRPRASS